MKRALQTYFQQLTALLPALLLFAFLLAAYFQRFITRPIHILARAVASVTHSGADRLSAPATGSREIRVLFTDFNALLVREYQVRRQLHAEKTRLHITLESIADGVITTDPHCAIRYMNPVAEQLTGWPQDEAIGRPLGEVYILFDEATQQTVHEDIDPCLVRNIVRFDKDHIVLLTRSGKTLAIQSSTAPMRDEHGHINGAVVVFHNVAEARAMARRLHHQATHDALIGLMNRAEFKRQLSRFEQDQARHTLLFLDLDQFKVVNDTVGHIAGDALLKQVALLLLHNVRTSDIVARLGGDEFALLLSDCRRDQSLGIAENIRASIEDFVFGWEDKTFKIGTSIGVVFNSNQRDTQNELMRAGDIACYAAKDRGRNRVHVYTEGDAELARRHGEMQWVSRIHAALEHDGFLLYVQRLEPLRAHYHHAQYEVLIRMRDAAGHIHAPGMFIPAAERYGLMPKIDIWVLERLLTNKTMHDCLHTGLPLTLNINLSGTTLSDAKYIHHIHALCQQHPLPAGAICFEITETAAIASLATTAAFMRDMKQLGCEFALDDFGSGLSTFAYLNNLPVDYIKIDGAFVHDMTSNPIHRAMVNAINEIGHIMDLKTVAEFVENHRTHAMLCDMGIDYVQGFHIHRPEPLQDVCRTLIEQAHPPASGGQYHLHTHRG